VIRHQHVSLTASGAVVAALVAVVALPLQQTLKAESLSGLAAGMAQSRAQAASPQTTAHQRASWQQTSAQAVPAQELSPQAAAAATPHSPAASPAAVTALLLSQGEQRGSGVLLQRVAGGTWLVTNRQVVDGYNQLCVRTADGRLWTGIPMLPTGAATLDLAFVWLIGNTEGLPLAVAGALPPGTSGTGNKTWSFPIVRASGYPLREERLPAPPSYREVRGLLLPLLPSPLEGGLQLATTSPVRWGMSGGGLFDDQDRLIGLNATHADPLWSAPLREENGKALAPEFNRQLELVALAIPVSRVLPLLADLMPPARPVTTSRTPAATSPPLPPGKPPLADPTASTQATAAPVCTGDLW